MPFSNKRSLFFSIAFCFILGLLSLSSVFAQDPPPDGNDPGDGGGGGDPDIPLDGGISLLLAAGAAYGAKKVYAYRNEKQED